MYVLLHTCSFDCSMMIDYVLGSRRENRLCSHMFHLGGGGGGAACTSSCLLCVVVIYQVRERSMCDDRCENRPVGASSFRGVCVGGVIVGC